VTVTVGAAGLLVLDCHAALTSASAQAIPAASTAFARAAAWDDEFGDSDMNMDM